MLHWKKIAPGDLEDSVFSKSADFGQGDNSVDLMEQSKEFESLFFETKKVRSFRVHLQFALNCWIISFVSHSVSRCDSGVQDKEKKRMSVGAAVSGGGGRRRGGGGESSAAVLDLKRANMIGIVMSRFKMSAAVSSSAAPQMRDVAAALREEDGSEGGLTLEDAQVWGLLFLHVNGRATLCQRCNVGCMCDYGIQALISLIPTKEEIISIKEAADKGTYDHLPDYQ